MSFALCVAGGVASVVGAALELGSIEQKWAFLASGVLFLIGARIARNWFMVLLEVIFVAAAIAAFVEDMRVLVGLCFVFFLPTAAIFHGLQKKGAIAWNTRQEWIGLSMVVVTAMGVLTSYVPALFAGNALIGVFNLWRGINGDRSAWVFVAVAGIFCALIVRG
ncbi:MAG: hypothetical protein IT290_08300 [Deltaproteobacteria bacterium]|nr:hypothetical protein [Deltaproteobacteria bacterium]